MADDTPDLKAVHDLQTALRNEGYTVGFGADDVVADFDDHVHDAQAQLDADDLAAFFVIAHREGQTDYASSVIVDDEVAWGVTQIQLLGAHFRTVLDALPLDTTDLIDAMVDEALTLDEDES
jgi:hypothetical protein